ncbi:MAG: HAMP domain-containing sensor histidine kinase [Bacteroidota bacterium]|nr:HAMP domain-containing sensor histidine kinase [Bacteroidota bacterium]
MKTKVFHLFNIDSNIYSQRQRWKYLLLVFAVFIGISSLLYTNKLVQKLSNEERKKVELWSEATKKLIEIDLSDKDLSFMLKVIEDNKTVPVILTNSHGRIISARNLDSLRIDDTRYLRRQLSIMKEQRPPIVIDLGNDEKNYIYYKDSTILTQLSYYPYIQLSIISLFILVSYFAFSSSRNAEQNKVWVGLSKETAHQLGTPTSSLMAWVELLKVKNIDPSIVNELGKDVNRLKIITERFSKVGSKPILLPGDIIEVLENAIQYIKTRYSQKVQIKFKYEEGQQIFIPLNISLFEWVIENICKNAVDAIEGTGTISISITEFARSLVVDISDTGKGIPKSKFKTVFKPGYTTKQRGWGLGLSLSKRIIEEYHDGKVFVYKSEIDKGTTFRILLKK